MKKLILIVAIALGAIATQAQAPTVLTVSGIAHYDGEWGQWKDYNTTIMVFDEVNEVKFTYKDELVTVKLPHKIKTTKEKMVNSDGEEYKAAVHRQMGFVNGKVVTFSSVEPTKKKDEFYSTITIYFGEDEGVCFEVESLE
jgi:hypothetical protein